MKVRLLRMIAAVVASTLVLVGLVASPAHAATVSVTGTVSLAATGAPAGANDVWIRLIRNNQVIAQTYTSADGTFTLANVEQGEGYSLLLRTLRNDSLSIWSDGTPGNERPAPMTITEPVVIERTLPEAGRVTGQISLGGVPGAEGVDLYYWECEDAECSRGSTVVTAEIGPDGRFELLSLGYGWYFFEAQYYGQAYLTSPSSPVEPFVVTIAGPNDFTRDIDFPQGGKLKGSVTFAGGVNPYSGEVELWERTAGGDVKRASIGCCSYQISRIPAGTHTYFLRNAGPRSYLDLFFNVTFDPIFEITRDFVMQPASQVNGTVRETTGAAIGEGTVVLRPAAASTPEYRAQVKPNGTYSVTNIPPGEYILRAEFGSGPPYWSVSDWTPYEDRLILGTNVVNGHDIVVYRGDETPTIEGDLVADATDSPIAGATVTLYEFDTDTAAITGDALATTTTDAAGHYRFPVDPELSYTLTFEADGYAFQTYRDSGMFLPPVGLSLTSLQQPGSPVPHRIASVVRLHRPAVIGGSLSSPNAAVQSLIADGTVGAVLEIRDRDSGQWVASGVEAAADADGALHLEVPPGDYRLRATYLGAQGAATVLGPELSLDPGSSFTFDAALLPYLRDIDGDLVGDVLGRGSTGRVLMYPGTGDGALGASSLVATGWSGYTALIQAGDTDGDGHADVLARDAAGAVWLFRGTGGSGTSTFAARVKIATGWKAYLNVLSPGDVNGDGDPDVLTRDAAGKLWMFPGDGAGRLGARVQVGSGWTGATGFVTPGDFDSDGYPDLIVRDRSGFLWLYRGIAAGTFSTHRTKIGSGWQNATAIFSVGDFDGDWFPDLLGRGSTGALYMYAGSGAGTLGPAELLNKGWQKATFLY